MHAFEYIVGSGKEFIAILFVDPYEGVEIYKIERDVAPLITLLRERYPDIKVKVVGSLVSARRKDDN